MLHPFVEVANRRHQMIDVAGLEVTLVGGAPDVDRARIARQYGGRKRKHNRIANIQRLKQLAIIDAPLEIARVPAGLGPHRLLLGHRSPNGAIVGMKPAVIRLDNRFGQMRRLGDL